MVRNLTTKSQETARVTRVTLDFEKSEGVPVRASDSRVYLPERTRSRSTYDRKLALWRFRLHSVPATATLPQREFIDVTVIPPHCN